MPNIVLTEKRGDITIISINRPDVRNCVDGRTASALHDAFNNFNHDKSASVAILAGVGDHFCAGADLKAFANDDAKMLQGLADNQHGPMGPTRMQLSKPVIAAISGYAVAGGIELAAWCDLRVADESAIFGVFCRRFGVPLIDGGTIRLPRLIGHSMAMDMILTGRQVTANEALRIGLANRVVRTGKALDKAIELATQIASFPQACLRSDRISAYQQWSMSEEAAIANEFAKGMSVIHSGESMLGATTFRDGGGRHGKF